ncbi:MAG: VOC family protein [Alphaproteobacteria bacterium]|nr:VOC family protein [Alphaproteobacteria bacterium]
MARVRAITGIDHLGIVSRDMMATERAYKRLGFYVTEPKPLTAPDARGRQQPTGQDSQHFVFRDTYVELTGITDPNAKNHLEPYIARYAGLHILALNCKSADAASAALRGEGLPIPAANQAGREVLYGKPGLARFKWFMIPPAIAPEGLVCAVEHVTPEIVYQDVVMNHPNGAVSLIEATLCTTDLAGACRNYQRFLGVPDTPLPYGRAFDMGESRVVLCDPAGLARRYPGVRPPAVPCYIGLAVGVVDLDHTRTYLTNAGVRIQSDGLDRLWVGPEAGAGAVVEFRRAD